MRELAKIEPRTMKEFRLETFLARKSQEGYRQSLLQILQIYVEKRKTLKGTSSSRNSSASPVSNGEVTMSFARPLEEEEIVKSLITEINIQNELLYHLKTRN